MRKPTEGLTTLEEEVMKILWDNNADMTISEIATCLKEKRISQGSVAQVIKRLLDKKMVTVNEHVLVSNVYARTFTPCIKREEYIMQALMRLNVVSPKSCIKPLSIVASLLESNLSDDLSEDDINVLETIIRNKKERLQNKRKKPQ